MFPSHKALTKEVKSIIEHTFEKFVLPFVNIVIFIVTTIMTCLLTHPKVIMVTPLF